MSRSETRPLVLLPYPDTEASRSKLRPPPFHAPYSLALGSKTDQHLLYSHWSIVMIVSTATVNDARRTHSNRPGHVASSVSNAVPRIPEDMELLCISVKEIPDDMPAISRVSAR